MAAVAARTLQSVGKAEGELNLLAWAGYVEDGSTDPNVDWVTSFEKQTGCQTSVKVVDTSDEAMTLMRTGQYDGVSASGNAIARAWSMAATSTRSTSTWSRTTRRSSRTSRTSPTTPSTGPLRDPARARGQPVGLEHGRRQAGAEVLGRHPRSQQGRQLQGQDQRLRRPDLHRRRGGIPEGTSARSRHREPVRARTRNSSTPRSTCSRSSSPNVGEYWTNALKQITVVHERRRRGRHLVAVPVLHLAGRQSAVAASPARRGSSPKRARPGGLTPG